MTMKSFMQIFLTLLAVLLRSTAVGFGKKEYSKKEGVKCAYCHPKGIKFKELTEAGKYYKNHKYSLKGYQPSSKSKEKADK